MNDLLLSFYRPTEEADGGSPGQWLTGPDCALYSANWLATDSIEDVASAMFSSALIAAE